MKTKTKMEWKTEMQKMKLKTNRMEQKTKEEVEGEERVMKRKMK